MVLTRGSTQLVARGRKRNASFGVTDCMASASVTALLPEASEQGPRKRQKRSSSTPPTPWSSQLSAQLQPHRRSRSRAGSPATDVEYVAPSRASARLARRIHSFVSGRGSDIYTHLAGPDGAGDLLSQPPAGAVLSNEAVGVQKPRERRRKAVDLTDENVKKDLMEEWARMRQSRGTLPLSGTDDNARCSQMELHDTRRHDGALQLEPVLQRRSPDAHVADAQGATPNGSLLPRMGSENALPADKDGQMTYHIASTLPAERGITQRIAPSEASPGPHVRESPPNGDLVHAPGTDGLDTSQHPASPQIPVVTKLPIIEAASLDCTSKDNHSDAFSPARSADKNSTHLDLDQEFYMLDIPEVLTLPWEPVASHLYVPPSLGKLISGMREQLTIEARARRRAEELYQAELSRRISAEKTIKDLHAELDRQTCQDGSG